MNDRIGRRLVLGNTVVMVALTCFFLIAPPITALVSIRDSAFQTPGVPAFSWRLHRSLAPRYAQWAQARISSKRAAADNADVAGTEWPLFGSVFYLWGVENLQAAWDRGDRSASVEPKVFARDAIKAASDLVVDPHQAEWVRQKWGTNYLHHQNLFYRVLLIAAVTSRQKLVADGAHLDLLRDQVESLSSELDASEHGLLNDYPYETYPGDVMAAVMCIRRADAVLGTDHSAFVRRALRAFQGDQLARHGLPPFSAEAVTGAPLTEPRGSGNSYVALLAPELWPEAAKTWFDAYDAHSWQEHWLAAGYREFVHDVPAADWFMEVDSGPVLAGHGISASAFGVGAARRNGRFDRAYPLGSELVATSWELPNGTLLGPSLLSHATDAPMLGEAAVFWLSTVQPMAGLPVIQGGAVPPFVYIVLCGPLLLGAAHIISLIRRARRETNPQLWRPRVQAFVWIVAMTVGALALVNGSWPAGLALMALGVFVPRVRSGYGNGTATKGRVA